MIARYQFRLPTALAFGYRRWRVCLTDITFPLDIVNTTGCYIYVLHNGEHTPLQDQPGTTQIAQENPFPTIYVYLSPSKSHHFLPRFFCALSSSSTNV